MYGTDKTSFFASSTDTEAIQLRKKLTWIARNLRHTTLDVDVDYSEPQSISHDIVRFQEKMISRKRIVLLTASCTVASCTMCHLPNEALWNDRKAPTQSELLNQFSSSFTLDNLSDYDMVTIYNNGNFFSDREVPPEVRNSIAKQVADASCEYLLVESLPQFITDKALIDISSHLKSTKLVLSIGLQSADDYVREVAVNSTCSRAQFERVVSSAGKLGHQVMVFLMFKPPFLTEIEAINDLIYSLEYLTSLGITEIAVCPTQIVEGTIAQMLYDDNAFSAPWLWSLIRALEVAKEHNLHLPRIAVSVLNPDQGLQDTSSKNCEVCTGDLLQALVEYNDTRDLAVLSAFSCSCKQDYETYLEAVSTENTPLPHRISNFVQRRFSPSI